jgi:hypothetical protein
MKPVFVFVLMILSVAALGQTTKSFSFCSKKFPVTGGCNASENSLRCNDGTYLIWQYLPNEAEARKNYEQLLVDVKNESKEFISKPFTCFLLGKKLNGYKLFCETKEGFKSNRLITYGVVNNQPVVLQLFYKNEMNSNKDVPATAKQIFRF